MVSPELLFKAVEDELVKADPAPEILGRTWISVWGQMKDIIGLAQDGACSPISNTDIDQVRTQLGFKASCKAIAKRYNDEPGAKKACVEFVCDTKGRTSPTTARKPLYLLWSQPSSFQ